MLCASVGAYGAPPGHSVSETEPVVGCYGVSETEPVVGCYGVSETKPVAGCYGVSEMESIDNGSSSSSASTEPWFCDACRAGIKPVSSFHGHFIYLSHSVLLTAHCYVQ